jgi:hypothetical protein
MRRSLPFRLAAAVLAAWFAVLGVQPNGMHSMTMGGMPRAQTASHAADAMADMAGHDSSPTKQDESNDCARHDCCCITTVVVVPRGAELAWVSADVVRREPLPPLERAALAAGEHVLPFANGPPDALAG